MAKQAEARLFEAQRSAALSEAHQALAEADARVADLERQLDQAHVLPVFAPVEQVVEQPVR